MALSCKRTAKCYLSKDGTKCTKPNAWIVFLRTHKNEFKTRKDLSKFYRTNFKVKMKAQMIRAAEKQNATEKQKKVIFQKIICNFFYKEIKHRENMPVIKRGVAKLVQKNSVRKTLSLVAGKKVVNAIVAKNKAVEKADDKVQDKKDTVEKNRREMTAAKKKAASEARKAKNLEKFASDAKAKAEGAKKASRARSLGARSSNKVVPTPKRVKSLGKTASKKAEIYRVSKRKASSSQEKVRTAAKKVKTAEKALVSAKKNATAVKKKRKRALDQLKDGLGGVVTGPRRKRRGTRNR